MEAISKVTGRACPIDVDDVDTDQLIPKQFLKSNSKTGFGPYLFFEKRYDDDGQPRPDHPLNKPEHQGAPVMLGGRNFGCGSSREHAPWALQQAGFYAIIAPSFADIFLANCVKSGIITVQLDESIVRQLFDLVAADPAVEVTVDLEEQRVIAAAAGGVPAVDEHFDIDQHSRHCLLNGLDDILLTLAHEERISAYEASRPTWRPVVPSS